MPNKIWHPSDLNSAEWFINGSDLTDLSWEPQIIPNAGTAEFLNLPEGIKNILRLDKPDLIATIELNGIDVPAISIEITTTTPQSQHAKQRFPRIVAAAESGVPAIYIIPNRKRSGGSTYRLGADLYFGAGCVQKVCGVPIFIYNYPDNAGMLLHDITYPNQPELSAESIKDCFTTIDTVVKHRLKGQSMQLLMQDEWIATQLESQMTIAARSNVQVDNYTTLSLLNTIDLMDFMIENTEMTQKRIEETLAKFPDRIRAREKTLIFRPGGRLFDHGNDPYSGMLAFFDYVFCRIGENIEDRKWNLIYMPINQEISRIVDEFAPRGYYKFWKQNCPFHQEGVPDVQSQFRISHHLQYGCIFSKIKPLRVLGYFSDLIIFQDAVLVF